MSATVVLRKYKVRRRYICEDTYIVEASDASTAVKLARKRVDGFEVEIVSPSTWRVVKVKE